ncbi:MAG: DUF2846 domain-containing protein [Desulfovibrionaceae bacterium]|nr:DUF2846 domain-containing protein [Desulfovibrionaceae bacterium]
MRKAILVLAAAVVCAVMFGCGTPMPGTYNVSGVYANETTQQGKATIYIFYRQNPLIPAPCFVSENGTKIGVIKSGTYFTRHVLPGEYEYIATNDSHLKSPIRIKTEAEKEYFIEATQVPDFLMAHPYLNVVGKEQAEAILPTLKRIAYTPKSQ